jgi:hypothetical protein
MHTCIHTQTHAQDTLPNQPVMTSDPHNRDQGGGGVSFTHPLPEEGPMSGSNRRPWEEGENSQEEGVLSTWNTAVLGV